ncbi:TIGR03084 family metal-binding protein [Actinomycetospora atypica]|uniref:TIGR03084 family metal-binding protein n=1 Tax=Actinomycetospora atypica TaxID=1290095 RepID=A0ABV9YQQ8_9PSEU
MTDNPEPQRAVAVLQAQTEAVDAMVAGLTDEQWALETPASGWSIADQIAHLAFVFSLAGTAASRPEEFRALAAQVSGFGEFDAAVNQALEPYRALAPAEILERFRAERDASLAALASIPADETVPWFVNPLPPVVLASAGMLECFAHGQDIADTLGVRRTHDDRIEYLTTFVAHTRDFGFIAHDESPPAAPFRFELVLPSGRTWTFGPEDATDRVTGDAVDVCLLAARRRHPDDLDVVATGGGARRWLSVAQAYRGPAGAGREARATSGPTTTIVRYEVTPQAAEENQQAIEKVMAELAETAPGGLEYTAYRLDDGVTFVHVATTAGGADPLGECAAFDEFRRGLPDRLVGPPAADPGTTIGVYRSRTKT